MLESTENQAENTKAPILFVEYTCQSCGRRYEGNRDDEVQAAIELEKAAKEDFKNANKAIKSGNKERKKLWKQKEMIVLVL